MLELREHPRGWHWNVSALAFPNAINNKPLPENAHVLRPSFLSSTRLFLQKIVEISSFTVGFVFEDWNGDHRVGTERVTEGLRGVCDTLSRQADVCHLHCEKVAEWAAPCAPEAAWGHPAIPVDKGREQAAWAAFGSSVSSTGIYWALFPGPGLRIRRLGCRYTASGPWTVSLLSGRETSKQVKCSDCVRSRGDQAGKFRQGEERGSGSGSLPTRVTWATGHAWASDSVELPDLTFDHDGMSLLVLHNDSWPNIYFIWCA